MPTYREREDRQESTFPFSVRVGLCRTPRSFWPHLALANSTKLISESPPAGRLLSIPHAKEIVHNITINRHA